LPFYEAANFAGVLRVPVIFVVINNGWAISTPVSAQTNAKNFAAKAHAFGFPGVTVDGTDPVEVFNAIAEARTRAVAGAGPTLVEAVTTRLAPHTTADDPTRYIPAEQIAVKRFEEQLTSLDIWQSSDRELAETEADERMDQAVRDGEANPANPIAVFDHVYAERTPRLERQRLEFIEHYGAGNTQ